MTPIFTNYHAHNKVNYFRKEAEEVVESVCHAPFYAEELDSSKEELSSSDEEDENYCVAARKIESFLRDNPPRGWEVDGPLNVLMTKEMIQEVLTDTFAHMKKTGQCITMSEYAKMEEQGKKFYKTDGKLTRIWGSNYANEKFSDSSEYKAARHYLVIPDSQQSINVLVTFQSTSSYPTVHSITDKGVIVVSELIEGKGIAPECIASPFSSIGYIDFSGGGNIIQETGTHIKYVVDTETKSFHDFSVDYFPNLHQLKSEIKKIGRGPNSRKSKGENIQTFYGYFNRYLYNRWETLSKSSLENQTFTIKV